MNNLEKAKEIITEYLDDGDCGLFDTQNLVGDDMTRIYAENGLEIYICFPWGYFEVFGLTDKEFAELEEWYEGMVEERW